MAGRLAAQPLSQPGPNAAPAARTAARSPIAAEIRATLAVAAPLAAANLAQMAMSVTNTVMLGHLGAVSLAAAGLGAGLWFTLLIVCQGVLTAVAPLAAHAFGAGDRAAAARVAGAGLLLAALLALPVIVLLTAVPALLAALGYAPDLVSEVRAFLYAARWGAPAFLGFAVLRLLLTAAGRATVVMLVPLAGIPVNAALNAMLIFGWLGAPALGSAGSGWASASVQWLTVGAVALYMRFSVHRLAVRIDVRIDRGALGEIGRVVRLGLPIASLVAMEVGLFATTGVLMGLLGADALGAHQLVLNVASICFMVPLGIAQAATVRVGFALGAGQPAAARRAGFIALTLGAAFMTGTALLLWAAPRSIAGLYLDLADPAAGGVVAIALPLFTMAALFQISDGVQVIAVGALRGYRDTTVPMLIAVLGYWGIGFIGGWVLAFPLGAGAVGLWFGLALGLAVVATALTLRLHARAGAEIRLVQPPAATPRPLPA